MWTHMFKQKSQITSHYISGRGKTRLGPLANYWNLKLMHWIYLTANWHAEL